MMHNWFECSIRYEKVAENGMNRKVTEAYLVDALSFTEARIIEEMNPYINGEFTVSGVKRAGYSELFPSEEDAAGAFLRTWTSWRTPYIPLPVPPARGADVWSYPPLPLPPWSLMIPNPQISRCMEKDGMNEYLLLSVEKLESLKSAMEDMLDESRLRCREGWHKRDRAFRPQSFRKRTIWHRIRSRCF